MKLTIEPGKVFGNLTVIKEDGRMYQPSGQWQRLFLCKCTCGELKQIRLSHLTTGRVKSCGCLKPRHGNVNTHLYNVWRGMLQRCKPNYFQKQYYADRGITVCSEWTRFITFKKWAEANGYNENLQIDRRKNDLGYYPENCRWVTQEVNMANRRVTKKVTYKESEFPLTDLLRKLGQSPGAIRGRLKRGWTVEDAFDIPINTKYHRA